MSETDVDVGAAAPVVSETDYRTGPMEVFSMARGKLLGPVKTNWPDKANPGKCIEYWHRTPNCAEDDQITMAQVLVNREKQGFPYIFMLRARDSKGNRIYKDSELEMIRTQFPPDQLIQVCQAFEAQCEKVLKEVSDAELGN